MIIPPTPRRRRRETPLPQPGHYNVFEVLDGAPSRDRALMRSFRQASAVDPDLRAEATQLGIEVGVPPESAERNLERVRALAQQKAMERADLARTSPILARQFLDPEFAALAHDDIRRLSILEGMMSQWDRGWLENELATLQDEQAGKTQPDAGLQTRIDTLVQRLHDMPTGGFRFSQVFNNPLDALRGIAFSGSRMAGMLAPSLRDSAPEAAIGAVVGGLIGAAGFGAGALPGAVLGAKILGGGELARQFFIQERGASYGELRNLGISHDEAATVSFGVGGVNAALEFVGLGVVTGPARAGLKQLVNSKLREKLSVLTRGQAIRRAAGAAVGSASGEAVTEALQEVSNFLGEELALQQAGNPNAFENAEQREDLATRIAEVMQEAFGAGLFFGGAGAGVRYAADAQRVRVAEASQAFVRELGEGVANSKHAQRSATQFEQFMRAAADGRPVENLYFEAELFEDALAQAGTTREALRNTIPEVEAQIDEAKATGGDIVIPTGLYAARIAPVTELHEALSQDARISPEAPSIRKLNEDKATAEELAAEAEETLQRHVEEADQFARESQAIQDSVFEQIEATDRANIRPDEARTAAAIFRNRIVTLAEQLGTTPAAVLDQFDLRIVADAQIQVQPREESDVDTRDTERRRGDDTAEPRSDAEATPQATTEQPQERRGDTSADARSTDARRADSDRSEETGEQLSQSGEPGFTRQDSDRGKFIPRELTVVLHEGADFSTVVHEMAHYFFEVHERLLDSPDAPQALIDDFETFLAWTGVESLETWRGLSFEERRPHTEAFAVAFEQYLFEGHAPSTKLARLFDKVRRFMVRVYQDVVSVLNESYRETHDRDLPALTAEMRGVFDRMLAADQQVRRADLVRGFAPLYESQEQAGFGDEQWQGYQRALDDAREASITDVTKASLRQMQWLDGARSRVLAEMQRKRNKERKKVRAEVTEEVERRPVYEAIRFVRKGELRVDDGFVTVEGAHKLNTDVLREILPDVNLNETYHGMTSPEGMHPEDVAAQFGYESTTEFLEALASAPPITEVITEETDARMLQEHSELVDEARVEAAIQEALHNQARARFVAVELAFLRGATAPQSAVTAAAKLAARRALGRKTVRSIQPHVFEAAEMRARRAAERASKKGDQQAAIAAKQQELYQHHLAREARLALDDIEKAKKRWRKFRRTDKQLGTTRNVDYVGVGRAILAAHDMGPAPTADRPHLEMIQQHAPELLKDLQPLLSAATKNRTPWRDLPLDELLVVDDALQSLWYQSRRDRVITVDGERADRREIVAQLIAALNVAQTEKVGHTMTNKERRSVRFSTWKAWARHVEQWAIARDGGTPGDIHRYLFALIREPVDAYELEKRSLVRDLHERINAHDFGNNKQEIRARELQGFVFKNKAQLVGALRHAGNESNLRRLLLGQSERMRSMVPQPEQRGGEIQVERWWRFINRMIEEGVLTQADFDLVQHMWDTYDRLLPRSQQANFDVYGFRFEEIPKASIVTPFGTYRGGYVPLKYDPDETVQLGTLQDPLQESSGDFLSSIPSTGRGFTFTRAHEVNRPLNLDVTLDAHTLDEHLRFIHLQRPGRDVMRLLRSPELAETINTIDPTLISEMFLPWMDSVLKNRILSPGGPKGLSEFLTTLRRRSGLATMFLNFSVAVQQLTGLGGSLIYVPLRNLRGASALYFRHMFDGKLTKDVMVRSEFMQNRLANGIGQIRDDINVLLKPSWISKAEQWTLEHGYFLQRWFQQPVDVITWKGAFDHAVESGKSEADAVRSADAAVRRSQSSGQAADLSRVEKGHPAVRLLMQFSTFWFTMANAVFQQPSRTQQVTAGLNALVWAGLTAGVVSQALKGGWEDDDGDGALWDDVTGWAFGETLRTGAGIGFPVLGPQLVDVVRGGYGGRFSMGAGVGALERSLGSLSRLGATAWDPEKDVTGRDLRDLGMLLSLLLGIPVTGVTDRARFLIDEEGGEAARGAVIGR